MDLINEFYLDVFKNKYLLFDGRAGRREYWMFVLFNFIASILVAIVGGMLGFYQGLSSLYSLAVLLPSLGLTFRRLHDTDRSAWWILISLVPFVGPIVLLVFLILEGTPGENKFGPKPE